ncbi:MAG: hypothetical protein KatS3mg022_2361 [Armatimonadota bacterium]|nr:MAG: hypothetical protein KatS3mg022_2361 [Armatimonadota bacterium]
MKEHGQTILKGAGTVLGVVTGIKIAEEVYIVYVDWDCSNRMRDMLRKWKPREPESVDWDLINRLRNQHIRDGMRDIGNLVGDVAKQVYRVRPAQ